MEQLFGWFLGDYKTIPFPGILIFPQNIGTPPIESGAARSHGDDKNRLCFCHPHWLAPPDGLVRAMPLSRPARHRLGLDEAFPPLGPWVPRPLARVRHAVACGGRSPTHTMSLSTRRTRTPKCASVRQYNIRSNVHADDKINVTFSDCNKKRTRSPGTSYFRSFPDECAPARRESAGFPLPIPMPTHPLRDSGPKRPSAARPRFPH